MDVVVERSGVAHDDLRAVGGQKGRAEQTDLFHVAEDTADLHGVALLERSQGHHEDARGDIREQARPGDAHRDARGGEKTGERVRLNPQHAQGREHENKGQHHAEGLVDVFRKRGIELAMLEGSANEAANAPDHPATDDVQSDRGQHLEREIDAPGHEKVPGGFHHGGNHPTTGW